MYIKCAREREVQYHESMLHCAKSHFNKSHVMGIFSILPLFANHFILPGAFSFIAKVAGIRA